MVDNNSQLSEPLKEVDLVDNENVDLTELKNIFFRNKKLILGVTFLTVIFGSLFAFTRGEIWKGQFQIVISNKLNTNGEKLDINNFAKSKNPFKDDSAIKTQVEILKSPSVLMPIFKKVKSYKLDKGKDGEKLRYRDWLKKNVFIFLKKDTFVLDVVYKDKDKNLILPTLDDISSTYQNYINEGQKKQNSSKIDFLSKQVKILKKKSDDSFRKAQIYALENDISIFVDNQPGDNEIKLFTNDVNTPNRFQSANEIRKIQKQLVNLDQTLNIRSVLEVDVENQKITDIEEIRLNSAKSIEDIKRVTKQIGSVENNLQLEQVLRSINPNYPGLEQINLIDQKLSRNRGIFKENDPSIRKLLNQRKSLLLQFKKNVLTQLKTKLISEKTKMDAAIRPKGVISEYKELVRNSDYNLNAFLVLQKALRDKKIESSESSFPWELITEPTLFEYPIFPEKKKILIFLLIGGLFLGMASSIIIENKKGIIFSRNKLKNLLKGKVFEFNNDSQERENFEIFNLFMNAIESKNENIYLLPIGLITENEINTIKTKLFYTYPKDRILVTRDLNKSLNSNNQIIICKLAEVTVKDIVTFENKLQLQGNNIKGSILVT